MGKKSHHDEIVDSHIKYAGRELLNKMANEAPSEEELAEFDFPSEKLDKRIASAISKKVGKKRARKSFRIVAGIAAGFLILIIVSTITIASSQALRMRFVELFRTSDDISETIYISDSDEKLDAINPGYLPEGYFYQEGSNSGILAESIYANQNENTIIIVQKKSVDVISYDTENSTSYETQINGNKAIVLEHPELNTILYFGNYYYYSIFGDIETEELILIVKSLPE